MVPLLLVLMIRCFKPTVNKNALLLEWSKPMRKGIQPISKRIELELMRMERVSHRIALMSPSLQPLTTGLRHRVTSLKALTIGLIQVRARLIPALPQTDLRHNQTSSTDTRAPTSAFRGVRSERMKPVSIATKIRPSKRISYL